MIQVSQEVIAKKLKEAREFLGYTQLEVAKYLGIPRAAISLLENGKRKVEGVELIKLSTLYKRPVEYWTAENPEPPGKLAVLQRAVGNMEEDDLEQVVKFAEFLQSQIKSKGK